MAALLVGVAIVVLGVLAYGWFEAGWLRRRVVEVEIAGLPPALDGLRIAHLSDFHLGVVSRGRVAAELAVAWVEERRPELVCVTGDLVSHPRGERALRLLLARLGRPYVVLGNHDVAVTRDPFSRRAELDDLHEAVLLRDETVTVELRGTTVSIAGVDPETFQRRTASPVALARGGADLRLLLCHFPDVTRRLPAGSFDLILAGHLHGGQIVIPTPRGRVTLAHPGVRDLQGVHRRPAGVLHVSPGLGTTFVPFRLLARPEVTELVLRPGAPRLQQSS
ncbi:putative phosphohydrolase [Gaiella occulta]|uniref:Putative phosphohydrolase n=1 Tax=Gaiella occulta TaxID=1002870 RepID=A0A7M2YZ90_9ACTN|nr:metallophosphoesterase [Gaiella occulta]RDI74807.1 putative phosphohydrolase [Gaiella occulta]